MRENYYIVIQLPEAFKHKMTLLHRLTTIAWHLNFAI